MVIIRDRDVMNTNGMSVEDLQHLHGWGRVRFGESRQEMLLINRERNLCTHNKFLSLLFTLISNKLFEHRIKLYY